MDLDFVQRLKNVITSLYCTELARWFVQYKTVIQTVLGNTPGATYTVHGFQGDPTTVQLVEYMIPGVRVTFQTTGYVFTRDPDYKRDHVDIPGIDVTVRAVKTIESGGDCYAPVKKDAAVLAGAIPPAIRDNPELFSKTKQLIADVMNYDKDGKKNLMVQFMEVFAEKSRNQNV